MFFPECQKQNNKPGLFVERFHIHDLNPQNKNSVSYLPLPWKTKTQIQPGLFFWVSLFVRAAVPTWISVTSNVTLVEPKQRETVEMLFFCGEFQSWTPKLWWCKFLLGIFSLKYGDFLMIPYMLVWETWKNHLASDCLFGITSWNVGGFSALNTKF